MLHKLKLGSCVCLFALLVSGACSPSSLAASRQCGDVILSSKAWLGGYGVDVRSNGTHQTTGTACANNDHERYDLKQAAPQYGFGWQCAELANRLYASRGWFDRFWLGSDTNGGVKYMYSYTMQGKYPGIIARPNGLGYMPVPGDLIVHTNGVYGHVSVIDYTDGSVIYAVEQNSSITGRTTYAFNAHTGQITKAGAVIAGVLHAVRNTAASLAKPSPVVTQLPTTATAAATTVSNPVNQPAAAAEATAIITTLTSNLPAPPVTNSAQTQPSAGSTVSPKPDAVAHSDTTPANTVAVPPPTEVPPTALPQQVPAAEPTSNEPLAAPSSAALQPVPSLGQSNQPADVSAAQTTDSPPTSADSVAATAATTTPQPDHAPAANSAAFAPPGAPTPPATVPAKDPATQPVATATTKLAAAVPASFLSVYPLALLPMAMIGLARPHRLRNLLCKLLSR